MFYPFHSKYTNRQKGRAKTGKDRHHGALRVLCPLRVSRQVFFADIIIEAEVRDPFLLHRLIPGRYFECDSHLRWTGSVMRGSMQGCSAARVMIKIRGAKG